MGLLGDIYSAIDTKKRQVKGLLDDFGGTVDMGVRRFREDQQNLQNLFANAYPMAGDKTVLNSPQQIAQFQREAADKAGEMGLAGATVWHSSPHKFDKFDSSKIGTGEGAQVYGHGIYSAESPMVSGRGGTYDRQFTAKAMGKTDLNPQQEFILKHVDTGKNDMEILDQMVSNGVADDFDQAFDALSKVKAARSNIYKTDLPDEHIAKMVDYNKPLSSQPKEFQDMLAKYDPDMYHPSGGDYDANELGQQTLQRLQKQWGETKTSAVLKGAGIPGIRYLDGGSRGAGAGTSNYVVFPGNEGLLSILERNGQPLK